MPALQMQSCPGLPAGASSFLPQQRAKEQRSLPYSWCALLLSAAEQWQVLCAEQTKASMTGTLAAMLHGSNIADFIEAAYPPDGSLATHTCRDPCSATDCRWRPAQQQMLAVGDQAWQRSTRQCWMPLMTPSRVEWNRHNGDDAGPACDGADNEEGNRQCPKHDSFSVVGVLGKVAGGLLLALCRLPKR